MSPGQNFHPMTEFQLAEAVFSKLAEDTDFIPDSENSEIGKTARFLFYSLSCLNRCQDC